MLQRTHPLLIAFLLLFFALAAGCSSGGGILPEGSDSTDELREATFEDGDNFGKDHGDIQGRGRLFRYEHQADGGYVFSVFRGPSPRDPGDLLQVMTIYNIQPLTPWRDITT